MTKSSFTLLEVVLVVVIVAILATFAIPSYLGARQKAVDREGQTQLRLISAAEQMHRLEQATYIGCGNTAECNTNLNLDLPLGGSWDYSVTATVDTFTATASGTKGTESSWSIQQNGTTTPEF